MSKVKRSSSPTLTAVLEDAAASPPIMDSICGLFDAPPPQPVKKARSMLGGGDGATRLARLEGVVLRAHDETVQGSGGPIPKRRLSILVTNVNTNGATDVVKGNFGSETYVLPTIELDSPAASERGAFKQRELALPTNAIARRLSVVSLSFYVDNAGGKEDAVSVKSVTPGASVEVSGLKAHSVDKGGSVNVYLNSSSRLKVVSMAPPTAELAGFFNATLSSPTMLKQGAQALSVAYGGFFDMDDAALSDGQMMQVHVIQSEWAAFRSAVLERLATIKNVKGPEIASAIQTHIDRIAAKPIAKYAANGESLFLVAERDSPFAPIVQSEVFPWRRTPPLLAELDKRDPNGPTAFYSPKILNVEISGLACNIEVGGVFVFDARRACEQANVAGSGNPGTLGDPQRPVVSMLCSVKTLSQQLGNPMQDKVHMGISELLPTSTFAAIARVFPADGGSLTNEFTELLSIDYVKTIGACSVAVSEKFIKDKLCEGSSQFVPDEMDGEMVPLPDGVTTYPTFASAGYQELTNASFKLSNFKPQGGKRKEFRVVIPGLLASFAVAGKEPKAWSDESEGEKLVEKMASTTDVKSFLIGQCLAYAMLV